MTMALMNPFSDSRISSSSRMMRTLVVLLLVAVLSRSCCSAFFLNEPQVKWTLGTGREMLRGNNVQVTRNGQHVFATSADGALIILSNILILEPSTTASASTAAAAADESAAAVSAGGGGAGRDQQQDPRKQQELQEGEAEGEAEAAGQGAAALVYEPTPTLQVFEPPRNDFDATIYCDSGVVLVDEERTDAVAGENDNDAAQFAVYGVTEELNDGTMRSYIHAVDTNRNLVMSSDALDGAMRGTPVVLGNRHVYVIHNVDDSFGRVSILNLKDNLALIETVLAEESLVDAAANAAANEEASSSVPRTLGPFAPAAGREIIHPDNGDTLHVLVFGESTDEGTSPFGNLYMLVAKPVLNSFQLHIVSTMPGATLHAPALSSPSSSSSSSLENNAALLQAFLGSYAAGVNAWTGDSNSRGGQGGGDLSSVLYLDEASAANEAYSDIYPSWLQRLPGDFFNPNAPIPVTPVLSQDASLLFVAGASNSVMALETQQGTTLWTLETQGGHTATPVLSTGTSSTQEEEEWSSGEVVYFIERDNGVVRQLDAQQDRDVKVNWEYSDCDADADAETTTTCQAVEADFAVAQNANVLYYADVQGRIIAMNVAAFETQAPVKQPAYLATLEPTLAPTLAATDAPAVEEPVTNVTEPVMESENTTSTTPTYPVTVDTGNDDNEDEATTSEPADGDNDSTTVVADPTTPDDDVGVENGQDASNNNSNTAAGSIRGSDSGNSAAASEIPPSSKNNDASNNINLPGLLGMVAGVLLVSVVLVGLFIARRRHRNNKQQRQAERNSQDITAAAANRWNYNRRVYEEECRLEEAETLSELSKDKNGSDNGKSSGKGGKRGGGGGGGGTATSRKSARADKKKRRKSRRLRRRQQANVGASPAGTALDSISESVDENSVHDSDHDDEDGGEEGFDDDDDNSEIMAGSEDDQAGFEIQMEEGNGAITKPVTKKNLEAAMLAAAAVAAAASTTTTSNSTTARQAASSSPTTGTPPVILSDQTVSAIAAADAADTEPIGNTASPTTVPRSPSPFVEMAAAPTTRASPAPLPASQQSLPFAVESDVSRSSCTSATATAAAKTSSARPTSYYNNNDSMEIDLASTQSFESEEPGRIRVIPRHSAARPISPHYRPASPDPSAFLSVDDSLYIEGESVASGRMCKSVKSVASGKLSVRTAKSMKSHPDDEGNLQRPPTPTNNVPAVGQNNIVSPPSMLGPMKNSGGSGSGNNSDDGSNPQRNKRTTATFTNAAAAPVRRHDVPPVVVSRPVAVVAKVAKAVSPDSSSDSDQPSASSTEPVAQPESRVFQALGGREPALRGSSVRAPRAGLFTRRTRPVEDYRAFASVVDNSDGSEASTHSESSQELTRVAGKVSLPSSVSSSRRKERDTVVVGGSSSSKTSSSSQGKDASKGKTDIWNSFLTELSKAEEQFFNPDIPKPSSSSSSSKRRKSGGTATSGQSKRRTETTRPASPPPPPPSLAHDDAPDSPPPPPPPPLPSPMHDPKLRLDTTDEFSDSFEFNSQSSDGGLEL